LFFFLSPFGSAAGSKDPKDDDRRGKLVSKGNGRIFDEKGGWITGSGNLVPLCPD
jgi:hypothetical protein